MINDYFDRIYCVNLDRRPDKWELCEAEFAKHNLNVIRFPAIDGTSIPYKGRLPSGAVGNALSHAQILRVAYHLNFDSVLILEDDVVFDDNVQEKFEAWRVQVPDNWDLLYFGGNHNWVKEIPLCAPNLTKITNTYATHCYAVRSTVFPLVIARLEALSTEGDVVMAEIQKTCNAYCFRSHLAWQRAGISDVFNKYVDYDFLRTL